MMRKDGIHVFGTLLLLASVCQAVDWQPQWKPTGNSEFEVCTQLRPWTIMDEGWETIFENVRMAGVNNIYLVAIMHQEYRPFAAPKFPHNPQRESFKAEDSVLAFTPDMRRYGKIKPARSRYGWANERNWMQELVDQCRKRNLAVGAEISHFPVPKSWLKENLDWTQKNAQGKPNTTRFCPHHPDIRDYVLALYADLAGNYDLDYIQTCQYLFDGMGCYCEHCVEKAKEAGIHVEKSLAALRKDEHAEPYLKEWTDWQRRAAARFYQDISETIGKENPKCHLRLNDVYTWGNGGDNRDPWKQGLDLTGISAHLGSMVNQDHQEQLGRENEDFALRKEWLTNNRQHLGWDKPLICSIAPRMKATSELVRRGIKVAVGHPAQVNGLALKHYDGASFSLLRAFKQGMIEAGVQGLTPTLGKEVEAMTLEGYVLFEEELAEEWGVKTRDTGRASYNFDLPSSVYDVRITYFDGPKGQSTIKLLIDGNEVASFKMNEDCNCWRWRRFENTRINQGDRITLVGTADRQEQARLDFIEFIKP